MLGALGITFGISVLAGTPIAFALGIAGIAGLWAWGTVPFVLLPQRMFTGVDSFVLMAVPFFVLSGELIVASGILDRLLRFTNLLVGHIRGGLAHVNIVASMIFAGISGSAVADATALGTVLIPAMERQYGDKNYAAAVCAGASIIGVIIPPSIPMIVYALASGRVSVAGLFLAGVIPGLLIGFGLMLVAYVIARRRGIPRQGEGIDWKAVGASLKEVVWALIMPIIIVGGILGGIVTPTEAGALAVLYAMVVGFLVTGELRWRHFPAALVRSGVTSAVVFLVLATANVVSWLLTAHRLPVLIIEYLKTVSPNPAVFLILLNVFLLTVGCLLDNLAAMVMLVPVLEPVAQAFGVDPLHFAMIFVLNNVIGLLTPPVGVCLFVVCGVANITLENLVRHLWPFLAWEIAVLGIVTYVPLMSLWLPRVFGF